MIDRFERFSYAMSEISRCWHRIASDEMEEYGLKGPYAVYFTNMYHCPDGITAAQLGEACSRDKADVSRAMALLMEKGLVERTADRRAYRVPLKLTEEGRRLAEHINAKAEAAVEYVSRGFSPEKREIFYEVLELICANLRELSREGLPAVWADPNKQEKGETI